MRPKTLGVISIFLLSLVGSFASAGSGLRVVALSGQPATDAGPGILFGGMSVPQIDRWGQVAFAASLTGGSAILREHANELEIVARSGVSPALWHDDATLGPVGYFIYNDAGDLVFNASGGSHASVYRQTSQQSEYSLIVTSKDPFPGAVDTTELQQAGALGLNNHGQILIQARVIGDYVNYNGTQGLMVANPTAELHGIVRSSDLVEGRDDDEWYYRIDE